MNKQIQIRIFPDGTIKTETKNIKGKTCTKYIQPLEEMLEAQVVDSEFTGEYYEEELDQALAENMEMRLENKDGQ